MQWMTMHNRIVPLLWVVITCTIILVLIFHPSSPWNITIPMNASQSSQPHATNQLNSSKVIEMFESPSANASSPNLLAGDIEELCDISIGKWVEDTRGPRYTGLTCRTLHEFNCASYDKEKSYLYWRWQPDECELPRMEPDIFLDTFRGKKMAFVGDSLARNQMESLQCILSQAENPIDISNTTNNDYRAWHFSYNFTLMLLQSRHLVEEPPSNGTTILHIDKLSTFLVENLPNVGYAIISFGNWYFGPRLIYENGTLIGCLDCHHEAIPKLDIPFVIRKVFRTIMQFISTCKECEGLVALLRTYTPSHFEGGSWFDGGHCNRTRPYNESELNFGDIAWNLRNAQLEEMEKLKKQEKLVNVKFGFLDVTKAMMMRADAHPGRLLPKNVEKNVNDCLHWCMPVRWICGVICYLQL